MQENGATYRACAKQGAPAGVALQAFANDPAQGGSNSHSGCPSADSLWEEHLKLKKKGKKKKRIEGREEAGTREGKQK